MPDIFDEVEGAAPPKEQGGGVDVFDQVEQSGAWKTQPEASISGPDRIDPNAQQDVAALQTEQGTPVAPGMPTEPYRGRTAAEGLNELAGIGRDVTRGAVAAGSYVGKGLTGIAENVTDVTGDPFDLVSTAKSFWDDEIKKVTPEQPSIAWQAGQNIVANIPGMAASIATGDPNVGLAWMGATSYGDRYSTLRTAGYTPAAATALSVPHAMAEVIGEKLPLEALMKPAISYGRRALTSTALDILGENVTTTLQDGLQKVSDRPDMTLAEFLSDLWNTTAVSAVSGPVIGAVAHVGHIATEQPFVPTTLDEYIAHAKAEIDQIRKGKPSPEAAASAVPLSQEPAAASSYTGQDRRETGNASLRDRWKTLTPDEQYQEYEKSHHDELTGLMNLRGWEATPRKQFVAYLDVDGLKKANSILTHEGGDKLLRAVADVLKEYDIDPTRKSGDEHLAQSNNYDILEAALKDAQERLANIDIEVFVPAGTVLEIPKADGSKTQIRTGRDTIVTKKGVHFSYGIGQDENAADKALYADKARRAREGYRGPGSESDRFTSRAPEGQQDTLREGSAQEVQPAQVAPAVPNAEFLNEAADYLEGSTHYPKGASFSMFRPSGWTFPQSAEFLRKVASGEITPTKWNEIEFVSRATQDMKDLREQVSMFESLPPSPLELERNQKQQPAPLTRQPETSTKPENVNTSPEVRPEAARSETTRGILEEMRQLRDKFKGREVAGNGNEKEGTQKVQGNAQGNAEKDVLKPGQAQAEKAGPASILKRSFFSERGAVGDLSNLKETKEPLENKNLATVHNITAENVRHAVKMGGMPLPSLAAIDVKKSDFHGFGEITLIARKNTFAPEQSRENKWFGADAYSPRYPTVEHSLTKESSNRLREWMNGVYDSIPENPVDKWKKSFHSAWAFEENIKDGGVRKEFLKGDPTLWYAFLQESGKLPKGVNQSYEGKEKVRKAVEKIGEDVYQQWAERKLKELDLEEDEKIFNGYTNAGNRRYLPHNLDTVVRLLKKQMKEGEGFFYGAGSIRSKVAPQFRTLKQIQEARGKIVPTEVFEKLKDEANNELIALADHYKTSLKTPWGDNSFGYYDAFADHIMEGIETRNFRKTFDQYYDSGVDLQPVRDFVEKLRNMPTEYFEGKIQRAVGLNEFDTAVVPDNAPKDVVDALKERGLQVVPYKSGDNADRKAKIQQVTEARRGEFLYAFPGGVAKALDVPAAVMSKGLRDSFSWMGEHLSDDVKEKVLEYAFAVPNFTVERHPARKPLYLEDLKRADLRNSDNRYIFSPDPENNYPGVAPILKLNKEQLAVLSRALVEGDIRKERWRTKTDVMTKFGADGDTARAYLAARQMVERLQATIISKTQEIALAPYENVPEMYSKLARISNDLLEMRHPAERLKYVQEMTRQAAEGSDGAELQRAIHRLSNPQYDGKKWKDTGYLGTIHEYLDIFDDNPGYFPRVREDGPWNVVVRRRSTDPFAESQYEEVFSQRFKTEADAKKMRGELIKDPKRYFPKNFNEAHKFIYELKHQPKTAEDVYADLGSATAREALINKALHELEMKGQIDGPSLEAFSNAILGAVNKEVAARGAGRAFIGRHKDLIEGYKTENLDEVLIGHITGMVGWLNKGLYAMRGMREMSGLRDQNDIRWGNEYFKNSMRNAEALDQAIAKARGVAVLAYLGGNIKSATVNSLQHYITAIPEFSRYTGSSWLQMDRARADVLFGHLTDFDRQVLADAVDKGVSDAQYVRNVSGAADQPVSRGFSKAVDLAMKPFQYVESEMNRKPAYLAAMRLFTGQTNPATGKPYGLDKDGKPYAMSYKDAMEKADEFVRASHFQISRENEPEFVKKLGPLGHGAYTFQSYTANYLNWMFNRAAAGEVAVLGRSMLAAWALGGLAAAPFSDEIDELLEKAFGVSVKHTIRTMIREHLAGHGATPKQIANIEDVIMNGIPGGVGVNISKSVQVNTPLPVAIFLNPDNTTAEKLGGVFTGIFEKAARAGGAAATGDWYRAAENMAPTFISNPMAALRQYREGATTASGKPVFNPDTLDQERLSAGETALKALGFGSTRVGKLQEANTAERNLKGHYTNQRDRLIARFRKTEGDDQKVFDEIDRFNEMVIDRNLMGLVPLITAESLQNAVAGKPNVKGLTWKEDYMTEGMPNEED